MGRRAKVQIVEKVLTGETQHGLRLLARHSIRSAEEFFQSLAGGKGIEKVLEKNTRSIEAWRAADACGIDPHDAKQRVTGLNFFTFQQGRFKGLDLLEEGVLSA